MNAFTAPEPLSTCCGVPPRDILLQVPFLLRQWLTPYHGLWALDQLTVLMPSLLHAHCPSAPITFHQCHTNLFACSLFHSGGCEIIFITCLSNRFVRVLRGVTNNKLSLFYQEVTSQFIFMLYNFLNAVCMRRSTQAQKVFRGASLSVFGDWVGPLKDTVFWNCTLEKKLVQRRSMKISHHPI